MRDAANPRTKGTLFRKMSDISLEPVLTTNQDRTTSCYNCVVTNSLMRWRIAVSAVIGFASGAFCWFLMVRLHQRAADFGWALHLADRLLAGQNPYDTPLEQYPPTAALFPFPLLPLAPRLPAS